MYRKDPFDIQFCGHITWRLLRVPNMHSKSRLISRLFQEGRAKRKDRMGARSKKDNLRIPCQDWTGLRILNWTGEEWKNRRNDNLSYLVLCCQVCFRFLLESFGWKLPVILSALSKLLYWCLLMTNFPSNLFSSLHDLHRNQFSVIDSCEQRLA